MTMVINGSGTITGLSAGGLPDATIVQADLAAGVAGNGPAFSAYGNAAQSIANTTWTKVAYNTESFDTNNNYDPSTYRFTPTVAGYYQLSAGIGSGAAPATGALLLSFYKNGAAVMYGTSSPLTIGPNLLMSGLLYLNGSTDYVEVYMYQSSGVSIPFGAINANYAFSASLVRAA